VQSFLEDLQRREGTTILLTTHDMAEAERLCVRIGFLAHGKLVAEGTATDLKRIAGAETLDDTFIALTGEELANEEVAGVWRETINSPSRSSWARCCGTISRGSTTKSRCRSRTSVGKARWNTRSWR